MSSEDLSRAHGASANEDGCQLEVQLPKIAGRECVPVRLLPLMTEWWPLSPDKIAELLGSGEALHRGRRWPISSYVLRHDGGYRTVLPRTWANISDRLTALAVELGGTQNDLERNLPEWERRSIELLPAAVFVWRDELAAVYKRTYGGHKFFRPRPGIEQPSDAEIEAYLHELTEADESETSRSAVHQMSFATVQLEGDGELCFGPVLSSTQSAIVFEGFWHTEPIASHSQRVRAGAAAACTAPTPPSKSPAKSRSTASSSGRLAASRQDGLEAGVGKAPGTDATEDAVPKPSAASRKSWRVVAKPYVVEKLRAGRFATAVVLFHMLYEEAGSAGSPFEKGEGQHRGSLWIREISAPLALKTIQNSWGELREAASGMHP